MICWCPVTLLSSLTSYSRVLLLLFLGALGYATLAIKLSVNRHHNLYFFKIWILLNSSSWLIINARGASLVVQWLRIHLPIQGTRVRALVREKPTCCRATKPVCHNYWACALEPSSHNYWAHMPQLLKPVCLEPLLHNKRSHCIEKPSHRNEE